MAVSSQKFDTLDGLNVTGPMDIGGNVTVDTNVLYVDTVNNRVGINKVPTVAFDVNGNVNIDGGTIDGLTQLSVDNLTLDGDAVSGSAALYLNSGAGSTAVVANSGAGSFHLRDGGTEYARFEENSGNLLITAGSSSTTALTLQSDGDAVFAANVAMSDNKKIDFGSAMDMTADSQGVLLNANTYHQGDIVSYFGGVKDTNTYLRFNGSDSFTITTGGTVRMTVDNSGVTIPGALLFDSVASDQPYYETLNAPGGFTFDLNNGSAFTKSGGGSGGTVVFTMPTSPGTNCFAWTIKFNNSGSLTWPASVKWSENTQPPESSGIDIYSFVTYDGGTNIYGSLAVRNAS